ncbi:MAG TPA: TlpA disulfide reductase family protein, partial [Vicinamibacteria bacterium]
MILSLTLLAALGAAQAPADAEVRVVEYLRQNVKPGERVVVSDLLNNVFTTPEERAALNRLFGTFFKIPLFVAQHQEATGQPPSLAQISEQFRFQVPGEADVLLRIMESDPRMPKFLERDPRTGEIARVDVAAVKAHPRFGQLLERSLAGFEGRTAPPFSISAYDGSAVATAAFTGKPHLLYFWFTNCPPCVRIAPLLVELRQAHVAEGFEILGVNADRVLEVPADDAERAAYASKNGIRFPLAHLTPEMQAAYGQVSVFPTLFFVDRKGTIVKQLVNLQTKAALEEAVQ